MISNWYNTNGMVAAGMLDVDDSFVLSVSNGEVLAVDMEDKPTAESVKGTVDDPEIFGKLLFGEEKETMDESMKMGHIALAAPILNIQYFKGRKPLVAGKLGMTAKDVEKVTYFSAYIVTEPGDTPLSYKQILTEKELADFVDQYHDAFQVMTGAEAIEYLLIKERAEDLEKMILRTLPVIPLCMRYIYESKEEASCNQEHYTPTYLNNLYNNVIMRNNRLRKLLELGAPSLIVKNEKRMLQESADILINNGVRGKVRTTKFHTPVDSLDDLYEYITELQSKKYAMPNTTVDVDKFATAVQEFWDYHNTCEEEEILAFEDKTKETHLDELEADIAFVFADFLADYLDANYPRYADFYDAITRFATHTLADDTAWMYKKAENPDELLSICTEALPYFKMGLAEHVNLYIKKRLKWNTI